MRPVLTLLVATFGTQATADRAIEVRLSGSDPHHQNGTWVAVLAQPIASGVPLSWRYTEADTLSVDVPDTGGAKIVAVRHGVVSKRIVTDERGPVYLRFERGFAVIGIVRTSTVAPSLTPTLSSRRLGGRSSTCQGSCGLNG